MYKYALVVLFFGMMTTSPLDKITEDFYHHPQQVLVSAHRADHALYPENSLPAIRQAIRAGIDIVELDVRETKDGKLVLMHDSRLDRTTNGKGLVSDWNYDDLAKLYLKKDDSLTHEHIPTFEAALIAANRLVMIDIDFKADTEHARAETYWLVQKYHMQHQVLFFVYDLKDVAACKAIDSTLPVMPRVHDAAEVGAVIKSGGFPVVHIDESFYSDSLIGHIRQANMRVWANALGKYDDMEEVKAGSGFDEICKMRQINVIQTNYPEELLAYLRKKGLHR